MRIDLPTCNLRYCRYFSDFNCTIESKLRYERCPYTYLRELIEEKGYLFADGKLIENKKESDINV